MKISEIYELAPQSETLDLEDFWSHVDELERYYGELPNTRIKTKVVWAIQFDHRRYWQLATVWLDDRPFGIIQNAGREGQDFAQRFWTDEAVYVEAIRYLRSLVPIIPDVKIYPVDFDSPTLTEFYGSKYLDDRQWGWY